MTDGLRDLLIAAGMVVGSFVLIAVLSACLEARAVVS